MRVHRYFSLRRHRHIVFPACLLALGVGAAIAMFSALDAISPAGLPYPSADRLVVARVGGPSWSPGMLEAVEATTTVFDAIAGVQERAATLLGVDAAEVVRLESVSASYFDLTGARPQLGRVFSVEEDRRGGATAVAVISDGLWRRRFGAASAALGQRLTVDGRVLEIIGVVPRHFRGLIGRTDVWTPLGSARWLIGDIGPERPTSRWFEVLARRKAALTHEAAAARFAAEAREAILHIPSGDHIVTSNTRLGLVTLAEARIPAVFPRAARILAIAVAAVLLLVVVSIASLHLVRLESRQRELSIRLSLGASLPQLARLAASEALVLAGLGALGAILVRPYLLAAITTIDAPSTTFGIASSRALSNRAFDTDLTTIAVAVAMALAGAMPLALGLVAKARRLNIDRALRAGGLAGGGLRGWRDARTIIVTVQAAIGCVVMSGGVLLARSAGALMDRDRGYDMTGVMTARVDLPSTYDGARAGAFYEQVIAHLARPGIDSSSVASCAPGAGRCRRSNISGLDGQPLAQAAQPTVGVNYVTPAHLATIGAEVGLGRFVGDADQAGAPPVVVISDRLAATLWPGASPLGRTLEIFTANGALDGFRTVVGTVKPIAFALENDPGLDVYLPAAQAAWTSGVIFVRGKAPAADLGRAIAGAVTAVDRTVPVREVAGLDVPLRRSLAVEIFLRNTLVAFGITGLLLAALGTYAVLAQSVARHRRELGVRIALGATAQQIQSLVSRRGAVMACVAAAAGAIGQIWTTRLLMSFLHGLPPSDVIAVASGPILTMALVIGAVVIPALNASRTDPLVALKPEA